MFGSFGSPANAYVQVGVETGVSAASPHQLILMLYDGLLQNVAQAREALTKQDVARKGELLTKAIRIIEEGLRASLDRERGGEIAQQLDALYEYMIQRLLTGNLRNDLAMLEEVSGLASGLRDAWEAMPQNDKASQAAA